VKEGGKGGGGPGGCPDGIRRRRGPRFVVAVDVHNDHVRGGRRSVFEGHRRRGGRDRGIDGGSDGGGGGGRGQGAGPDRKESCMCCLCGMMDVHFEKTARQLLVFAVCLW